MYSTGARGWQYEIGTMKITVNQGQNNRSGEKYRCEGHWIHNCSKSRWGQPTKQAGMYVYMNILEL